jgi:hypothetical protein
MYVPGTQNRQAAKHGFVRFWWTPLLVRMNGRASSLQAEGLPVESYLDSGDRARFANGGAVTLPHPNFAARAWKMSGCAALILSRPVLQTVRRRLARRAGAAVGRDAIA